MVCFMVLQIGEANAERSVSWFCRLEKQMPSNALSGFAHLAQQLFFWHDGVYIAFRALQNKPELAKLLKFKSGTWPALLLAFWAYIRDCGLQVN